MFQQYIANLREKLTKRNSKLIHPIYISEVKTNNRSYKLKMWMLQIMDGMLICSSIKCTAVQLFIAIVCGRVHTNTKYQDRSFGTKDKFLQNG